MGRSPRRGICANRERARSFGKVPVVFKVYVTMELRKEEGRRGLGAVAGGELSNGECLAHNALSTSQALEWWSVQGAARAPNKPN